jgi:hypothetical protein
MVAGSPGIIRDTKKVIVQTPNRTSRVYASLLPMYFFIVIKPPWKITTPEK